MIDDRLINPFGTDPANELAILPRDEPLWTEYCYFHCHDPVSHTGISMHIGREPYDHQIWRATLGIYLPGGNELLVSKTSGRHGNTRGGGTGPLRVVCVEPFRLWTVEYDGSVQAVPRAQNAAEAHRDSPSEPARFFLRFECAAPMWDLGQYMKGQPWASAHWEQICRVSGEIVLRGKTYAIYGAPGSRDHSCGKRDFGPIISDFWANMLFPSGKAVMVQCLRIEGVEDEIRDGYMFRGDGSPLEPIEVMEAPVVNTIDTADASIEKDPLADETVRNFRFVIKTRDGLETIEGELVHSMATTFISPNDELIGTDFTQLGKGQERALQSAQCAAVYRWNGETGGGNRERLARIRTLR